MNKFMKKLFFIFLGIAGFLSLICSIAATSVTNESLMLQGFQQFSRSGHLGVGYARYGDYAHAVCQYLDGKTDVIQVKNPDSGQMEDAFSEKENLHLRDVRGIVTGLKIMRYAGGAIVIAALGLLYLLRPKERPALLSHAVEGFALASMALLLTALSLLIWALIDFHNLFWAFHQVAFTNDLWLMDPQTDLLVALMPEPFFSWYAGEILKSLLPMLGMMLTVIVIWLRYMRPGAKSSETDIPAQKAKEGSNTP